MTESELPETSENGSVNQITITFSDKPVIEQIGTIRILFEDALKSNPELIIIDLSKVDYLCSTSLAELVRIKKAAIERGFSLKMINASEYIREIFRTTRLQRFFDDTI